jgi:hypothetical protein
MQKHINYTDFFQFFLHIPIAVFEEISNKQIVEDCIEMAVYPIIVIRDEKHPLFIRLAEDFKKKGVTQDLKLIILAIGYNKPYLS